MYVFKLVMYYHDGVTPMIRSQYQSTQVTKMEHILHVIHVHHDYILTHGYDIMHDNTATPSLIMGQSTQVPVGIITSLLHAT